MFLLSFLITVLSLQVVLIILLFNYIILDRETNRPRQHCYFYTFICYKLLSASLIQFLNTNI